MKNTIYTILFLFLAVAKIQGQTNVYFLPGQGADERLFSKIVLDSNFITHHIRYPIPERKATMTSFAKKLLTQIDTTHPFILVGTSLGGMLSVELAAITKPQHVFIISSAKNRWELPRKYRIQKKIPINRLMPKTVLKWGALLLQPLVEPDRNKEKETFKSMLRAKDKTYMKRSIDMITHWERTDYDKNIIHIHGDEDHTLPIKNVKPTHVIKNGSHMMTLTRGDEINSIILKKLNRTNTQ
jgi:pimeloyl-ACP methyl ester carboxylesterase